MAAGSDNSRLPVGMTMERLVQLMLAGEVLARRDELGPLARPWGQARRSPENPRRGAREKDGRDG